MPYRPIDAFRRADLSLAGAVFLTLATAGGLTAYATTTTVSNAPKVARFRPAILEAEAVPQVQVDDHSDLAAPAPEVTPAPRPAPGLFGRLKITVALENLAAETSCLAEALYYEARGQGTLGQQAIAEVVVRRTHRAGYPHSICGVVHQGTRSSCQFSFVCDGTMSRPRVAWEWNRAVRLATQIINGVMPLTNITQDAISFHAARIAADWPGMVPTATIGNNVFYRRSGSAPVQVRRVALPQTPVLSASEIESDVQARSGVSDGTGGNVIHASLGNAADAAQGNPSGSLQQGTPPVQSDSPAQVIDTHVVEQNGVNTN